MRIRLHLQVEFAYWKIDVKKKESGLWQVEREREKSYKLFYDSWFLNYGFYHYICEKNQLNRKNMPEISRFYGIIITMFLRMTSEKDLDFILQKSIHLKWRRTNQCNLQHHINFILSVNLKVTMKFPYEVHLSSIHSIIPRHREVERCAKMLRIGQSAKASRSASSKTICTLVTTLFFEGTPTGDGTN